jgi:hypothetical protein
MHPYYIGCDVAPTVTNNGNWTRCPTTEATEYTEQQIQDAYSPESMTYEQARELGLGVWIALAIAFGVRIIIHNMRYLETYS